MKKRYTFIVLLCIMLYLLYLILSYKYTEYRIFHYVQELTKLNEVYLEKISDAREVLENKNTKAYKNKVLKSQQSLRNPGEEVVSFISEEKYNKYTQEIENNPNQISQPTNLLDEESLIQTMSIYEKWVYLIFGKDIR